MKTIYYPVFRVRQQEIAVLQNFNFGDEINPIIEIIKEKDRANNKKSFSDIYNELISKIQSNKVFVDFPTYLKPKIGMQKEVINFIQKYLFNLDKKVELFRMFNDSDKIIPILSSFVNENTGESVSIKNLFEELKNKFNTFAFRVYDYSFDHDIIEIKELIQNSEYNFYLIYDIDDLSITNPLVQKQKDEILKLKGIEKIIIRSAINSDIQNVKLIHEDIVAQADNSLLKLYNSYLNFDKFGDYVGIKKDDFSDGGTISPGFIIYDPISNFYYGYKGDIKKLEEFETTIVPAVLNSDFMKKLENTDYLKQNWGYDTLMKIYKKEESGKSQAKFKRISMEFYLRCIQVLLNQNKL